MKLQLRKEYRNKNIDFQNAKALYKGYIDDIPNNFLDIEQCLQEKQKAKTNNQITVSVLCGLIFLSNARDAEDILYKAKYKHGQAGNMVLTARILYFKGDSGEKINREQLECDFKEYWNSYLIE